MTDEVPYPQIDGSIIATMYFILVEEKYNRKSALSRMIALANKYNVSFRSIDLEMLFRADVLSDTKHPSANQFPNLCYQCMDFTKLKTILPPISGPEYRGYNHNIKSIGKKGWI